MRSFGLRPFVLTLLVSGWLLCSGLLLARETARMPKEHANFTAEVTTAVVLRTKPPNLGYLFITGPGKGIGLLEKGEKVKVRGKKVIRTFFGDDIWVRVSRLNQGKSGEAWAYFGTPDSSPYFHRVTSGD